MPAVSGKQYRAMAAAMGGHSTLGIPQSVGEEFVRETPPAKRSRFSKKRKRRKHSAAFDRLSEMAKE